MLPLSASSRRCQTQKQGAESKKRARHRGQEHPPAPVTELRHREVSVCLPSCRTGLVLPLPVTQSSPPLPHRAPARWAKPHSGLAMPVCPQPVPSSLQAPADSRPTAHPGVWLQRSEPDMEKCPDALPTPVHIQISLVIQAEVLLVPPTPFHPSRSPLAAAIFPPQMFFPESEKGEKLSTQLIPAHPRSRCPLPKLLSLSRIFHSFISLALIRAEIAFPHAKAEH